ncbi:MAG: hydroxylamine oxidoreductase [Deltaproteobacteria bacterium]|nr:hydroxylamine oxidoreductase [Deltaproteobacteria bacterium]
MNLNQKRLIIAGLAVLFLLSLVLVQWMEVIRRQQEAGVGKPHVAVPASSRACVDCHGETTPGVIDHWKGSKHAVSGVSCFECHQAEDGDVDGFSHFGSQIATVVTPMDCGRCHGEVAEEFQRSHHAKAGNILASLDNFLAETVEGARQPFNPHSPTPGKAVDKVNGTASAFSGCQQCHGSAVSLRSTDGGRLSMVDFQPDENGKPTVTEAVARILRDDNGKPLFDSGTWPNTGIGRLNLDGSRGSCSACHSRHDFSPRRARQPENCGKCHLGPDHPQKEIFEESKHGVAYRDLKEDMNLEAEDWVLGEDYSQAPTCATCHLSGHSRNGGKITHDPGQRISWTNRPPISLVMDTDAEGKIVKSLDPAERESLITDTAEAKRNRMKAVCTHCHTPSYVNAFYSQYDDLVILYNEKFAKPGKAIMGVLQAQGLLTPTQFDEQIEWTWFYLWHHEGRRARHGASMMAPDYTHWHGMYEVAERFYMELIPEAREIAMEARAHGKANAAQAAEAVINGILARPEHAWFEEGAEGEMRAIRKQMEERYGQGSNPSGAGG